MNAVSVYEFEYFDRNAGVWKRAPDSATKEAIREMDANILPGTEQLVADSRVSRSGMLRPLTLIAGWD